MPENHSAEWLRGAVESHINTCNLITSITSATKSHPARQGLVAAGNELHNQLDRYRALLAAAEARDAGEPTAEEVIEACEVALKMYHLHMKHNHVTYLGFGYDAERQEQHEARVYVASERPAEVLALIADWKAGRG